MSEIQDRLANENPGLGQEWAIVVLKPRVDSFNHAELTQELATLFDAGRRCLALDLTGNRFFCLQAIKVCVDMAAKLSENGGAFALVGCNERTRRHFEVYGSLKHILMVRYPSGLQSLSTSTVKNTDRDGSSNVDASVNSNVSRSSSPEAS